LSTNLRNKNLAQRRQDAEFFSFIFVLFISKTLATSLGFLFKILKIKNSWKFVKFVDQYFSLSGAINDAAGNEICFFIF